MKTSHRKKTTAGRSGKAAIYTEKHRELFLATGLSLLIALLQALGLFLVRKEEGGSLELAELGFVFIVALLCTATFLLLFDKLCKWLFSLPAAKSRLLKNPQFYWLAMMAGWTPCFLAYYPAIYSYDGEPQLLQYTQHAFDNHHPLLHTLIMGICYDAGQFLQDRLHLMIDGMAIYAVLQMLLLSGAFAMGFAFLIKKGCSQTVLFLTLLWFIAMPLHPLMAVTTTKDSFFTAFFVMYFVLLAQILSQGRFADKRQLLSFVAVNLGLMLFRKNGVYMTLALFLVLCAVTAYVYWRKKAGGLSGRFCMQLTVVTALGMLLFISCDSLLMKATGAVQGEAAEALSVPLQQMARTYKSNGDRLLPQELAQLTAYVPEEGLNNYRPYISDGVKQRFNNELFAENKKDFFRIYLTLGKKYPGSYVTAFLYQTMGDWYLADTSHCRVYEDWWRNRTGYFITDATPVFALGFMEKENLLPVVRALYERVATECVHQNFWPARILFAPAFYCYALLAGALLLAVRKRGKSLLACIGPLCYLLTVVAGPCMISRYIYPFVALLPFLAAEIYGRRK